MSKTAQSPLCGDPPDLKTPWQWPMTPGETFYSRYFWRMFDKDDILRIQWMAFDIWENEKFEELPILADLLEDCNASVDECIFHHLRGSGPHDTDCWALGLCMGKDL